MDFLLHDVYLPGFAHDGTTKALTGQTQTKQNSDNSLLPTSFLKFLRDPHAHADDASDSWQDSGVAKSSDKEWKKQVLYIKLQQVRPSPALACSRRRRSC